MQSIHHQIVTLALAGALGALASAPVLASSPSSFKSYDRNGDGKISMQEFQAKGGDERAFRATDADRDSSLSQNEFAKMVASPPRMSPAPYGTSTYGGAPGDSSGTGAAPAEPAEPAIPPPDTDSPR